MQPILSVLRVRNDAGLSFLGKVLRVVRLKAIQLLLFFGQ